MQAAWQRIRHRFPPGFFLWVGLALLLAIGVLISLADLAALPATQIRLANSIQQRVVIDPQSGAVSGLRGAAQTGSAFDIAAAPEPAAPASPEDAPANSPEETPAHAPPPPTVEAPMPSAAAGAAGSAMPTLEAPPGEPSPLPTVARGRHSLVPAPAPEITETSHGLNLPKRGEKDAAPSHLYARTFAREAQQPLVAVVITDVGFSAETLKRIIDLPPQISIAISPYAIDAAKQIAALRNSGHEVWAMLPAMGARYPQDDPGPLGLIANLELPDLRARLHRVLAATIGSVGVVLPADETLSAHADVWTPLSEELQARGLYILSTHPTHSAEGLSDNPAVQAAIRRADMVADSTPSPAFIRSKLASIRQMAGQQEKLIVLISARPQSLGILEEWLQGKPLGNAVALAPLSAIYAPDAPPAPPAAPPAEEGSHGGGGH